MDVRDLLVWLIEHGDTLFEFLDFEAPPTSTIIETDISPWCGSAPSWQTTERFFSIGTDGSGSEFAVWESSTHSTNPIVYFGSEGGRGVLAPDPISWVRAITYAPFVDEYDDSPDPSSRLSLPQAGCLPTDFGESCGKAAARYKNAVESRFGPIPPFSDLVSVPPEIRRGFNILIDEASFQFQLTLRAQREADEQAKTEAKNVRAQGFSDASTLPADWRDMSDGTTFAGRCPSCGANTELRLVRHGEFAFALCFKCYFSKRW